MGNCKKKVMIIIEKLPIGRYNKLQLRKYIKKSEKIDMHVHLYIWEYFIRHIYCECEFYHEHVIENLLCNLKKYKICLVVCTS